MVLIGIVVLQQFPKLKTASLKNIFKLLFLGPMTTVHRGLLSTATESRQGRLGRCKFTSVQVNECK